MNAFSFRTVPDILCESGSLKRLPELLAARFPGRRLLIISDAFLGRQDWFAACMASLRSHSFQVQVDTSVQADPPEDVVIEAALRARDYKADVVIGLGGGSSMDVAKLVAVLALSSQPLQEMYGIGNCKGPRLPLVQIPTTAGTGSEVTPISIVTTGATTKMGVVSPVLYADFTLLDAELTLSLPREVTAATGIDAMVHAIEAYTTRHLKNTYSDLLATKALRLLSKNLLPACEDGNNVKARQSMLLGSMLAGQAFANAPCAGVHALAYPLGGFFHVPHGLSNALVLAEVARFNATACAEQYADIAEMVIPDISGSQANKTDAFIHWCDGLALSTGIATCLRDVGVKHTDLGNLADAAMLQTRLLNNNPRTIGRDDAYSIYEAVL
jgi:alcohol dehydrogenase